MKVVFESLRGEGEKLNWLITDFECNYLPDDRLKKEIIWIKGFELYKILNKYQDLQFAWGVFSGFSDELDINIADESTLPYADGNPSLLSKDRKPQHDDAVIEIVAWDSSETIFTSDDQGYISSFRGYFPDAEEL